LYRVQVGAFVNADNARRSFDRLQAAGFRPVYERHGVYYRVVISGVRAAEMPDVIRRLGSAGFNEAWLREEF
jgi:cell division septation protein DedD